MVNLIFNQRSLSASFYGNKYNKQECSNGISSYNKKNCEFSPKTDVAKRVPIFSFPFYTQNKNYNYALMPSFKAGVYTKPNDKNISISQNSDIHEKAIDLAKEYSVQLGNNKPWFEARKGKILQPSEISKTTLKMIAEKSLKDMEGIPADRIFYIVSGRIGCGKTTFVKQKQFGEYCYIPDCDDIKPFLPGYKDKDSSYVHLASSSILAANLYEAFKRGLNVVFQTSTEERFLDTVVEKAKQSGYKNIVMFHINTNEENSIDRANKRSIETGRIIKPDVIRGQKYIDDLVSIYKNPQKGLSELIVYDNNSKDFVEVEHFTMNGDKDESITNFI